MFQVLCEDCRLWLQKLQGSMFARMVQVWVPLAWCWRSCSAARRTTRRWTSIRRPGGARGALDALKALALMLSKALGLISLALELVLSGAQDCKVLNQTVALVALDAITRS